MSNTEILVSTLKRVLKSRHKTYADVAEALDLSEASVKRLFAEKSFSLQRLDELCQWLELDFYELARLGRHDSMQTKQISLSQEAVLAQDLRLLGMFYLVLNGWQLDDIVCEYEMSKAECIQLLIRLHQADLIELLPDNRVRLRVSRHFNYHPYGPIRMRHGQQLVDHFLSVRFDEHHGHFEFLSAELSDTSIKILERKMAQFVAEFNELSAFDLNLPIAERQLYGVAFGMRPWTDIGQLCGIQHRQQLK